MSRSGRRFVGATAALLWLVSVLSACGGGIGRDNRRPSALVATPSSPPMGSSRSTTSPTCRPAASGRYTVAGRSYLLSVPARLPQVVDLVVDLHGYQQSAAAQERYTGFAAYAVTRGVAVLTPEGQRGGLWNFPRSPMLQDDVAFLHRAADDAGSRLCRPVRVSAVGWSDGADMAATLACAHVVTTVAGVALSVFPSGPCPSPPPLLEVHGTADPFVPYAGGGGDRTGPYAGSEAQGAEARLSRWASAAGCSSSPRILQIADDVSRLTWGRCAVLYRVDGGGHSWPGHTGPAPIAGLGATTLSLDANRLFVDFLESRPG